MAQPLCHGDRTWHRAGPLVLPHPLQVWVGRDRAEVPRCLCHLPEEWLSSTGGAEPVSPHPLGLGDASVRPQHDPGLPVPASARSSNLGSEMWLCVSECAVAHCLRGDLVSLLPWGPVSGRKAATWAGGRGGSRLRDVPGTACPIPEPGARLLPCAWAVFCSLPLFLAILCHSSRAEAPGSPGFSLGSSGRCQGTSPSLGPLSPNVSLGQHGVRKTSITR